jgi:hypothetical protein
MLLEAAAQSGGFKAVVSEGAGGRVGDEDVSGLVRVLAEPNLAVMTAALTVFSNQGPPPPIVDRIGQVAPRPVLLVYADPGMGGFSSGTSLRFAGCEGPVCARGARRSCRRARNLLRSVGSP